MSKIKSLAATRQPAEKQTKTLTLPTGYLLISESDDIVYANQQARHFLGVLADEPLPQGKKFLSLIQSAYQCYPTVAWLDWPERPSTLNTRYLIYTPPNSHSFSLLKVEIVEQLIVDGCAIWAIAIDLVESKLASKIVHTNIHDTYQRQA